EKVSAFALLGCKPEISQVFKQPLTSTGALYVFSAVRPSSGAATLARDLAFELFSALENAELAVAENGHTPLNRYRALGRCSELMGSGSRFNGFARLVTNC